MVGNDVGHSMISVVEGEGRVVLHLGDSNVCDCPGPFFSMAWVDAVRIAGHILATSFKTAQDVGVPCDDFSEILDGILDSIIEEDPDVMCDGHH